MAAKLAERLGQPIIIDNVPGKGGNDGTALAAKAAPDGYTLLLGSIGPLVVHQFTYTSLPFDPERDFVPIALLESSPILLVAASSAPVASARELIDLARALSPAAPKTIRQFLALGKCSWILVGDVGLGTKVETIGRPQTAH